MEVKECDIGTVPTCSANIDKGSSMAVEPEVLMASLFAAEEEVVVGDIVVVVVVVDVFSDVRGVGGDTSGIITGSSSIEDIMVGM